MKKYLFLLITFVVTSLAFVSCSDDDVDNQYNSAIVGTWKITEVKTSQSGSYMDWPFKTTYASFKSMVHTMVLAILALEVAPGLLKAIR